MCVLKKKLEENYLHSMKITCLVYISDIGTVTEKIL